MPAIQSMFSHVTTNCCISYLVDAKKAGGDRVKRKVLFENVLINTVHPLLNACHVVAQIPHVDLVVKLKAVFLTLYRNITKLHINATSRHLAIFSQGIRYENALQANYSQWPKSTKTICLLVFIQDNPDKLVSENTCSHLHPIVVSNIKYV